MLEVLVLPEKDQFLLKSRRGRRGAASVVSPFVAADGGYRSAVTLPLSRSRRVHRFHRVAPHLSRYWVNGHVEVDVVGKLPSQVFGGLKAGFLQAACRLAQGELLVERRLLLELPPHEIEIDLGLPPVNPLYVAEKLRVFGAVMETGFVLLTVRPKSAVMHFTLIDPGWELVGKGFPSQALRVQRLINPVAEMFMVSPEGGVRLAPGVLLEDFSDVDKSILVRCEWNLEKGA